MILAFDSYYFEDTAKTIAIQFDSWETATPTKVYSEVLDGIAEYEPGAFYKRELPCILSLLGQVNLDEIDFIMVDSYVLLNDEGKLGLGGYLYHELNKKIPVIGVAKTGFHNNKLNSKELLPRESKKPLHISAIGITLQEAYEHIKSMHGAYRMPTISLLVDGQTKSLE